VVTGCFRSFPKAKQEKEKRERLWLCILADNHLMVRPLLVAENVTRYFKKNRSSTANVI